MGKPITFTVKQGREIRSVTLSNYASESARVYAVTLVDACRRRKIDPRDALINTDSYPVLMRHQLVEFAIGWFNGCADCHEVKPEQLFDAALAPELAAKITELKRAWGRRAS
ncbi:MAG TPA: hypothetical protein VFD36_29425 [Kofleriaceae bacterium]|nr:hypothetical protein [Kofleriaceae bacterium]